MKAAVRKGFTLIEILIVVIILGILAAIVIPQFTNASNDAKVSAVQSTVQSVQSQAQLFQFQTNSMPGSQSGFWADLGTKFVVDGKTVGPWITAPSVNPFTNSNNVAGGNTAPTSVANWYYDSVNGKFYGYLKSNGVGTFYPSPN